MATVLQLHGINAREALRYHSVLAENVRGQIAGFGVDSYLLALGDVGGQGPCELTETRVRVTPRLARGAFRFQGESFQ